MSKTTLSQLLRAAIINIYTMVVYPDIAAARFACALSALVYGGLYLVPGTTMDPHEYVIFLNIMTQSQWAAVFVVVGSLNMYTLVARTPPGWHTVFLASLQMILWVFVTLAFALPWINGIHRVSAEGVMAWLAVWVFIRSRNGTEEDVHLNCGRRITDRH